MNWPATARDQGGVISQQQLLCLGLERSAIQAGVVSGRFSRTAFKGVLQVAGSPIDERSLTWIAVLASKSALSFASAARVWDLPVAADGLIHITRPDRKRYGHRRFLRVHRCALGPTAVTDVNGLPVTTRQETILDCLGRIPLAQSRDLLDRSFQQNWLDRRDVLRRLTQESGRWGNQRLRRLLHESEPGCEAKSERLAVAILRSAGVQGWVANYAMTIGGERMRLDIAIVEQRIAIEIDGWAHHRSKQRRDNDMRKSNALTAAGWRVLRFSWEDVNHRPGYMLATVDVLITG